MIKIDVKFLWVLLFAVLFGNSVFAQTRDIGVGGFLQVGNEDERGGITAKFWTNANQAFELNVSIEPEPFAEAIGAYLGYYYHFWNVIPISYAKIPLYLGPLAGIGSWKDGFALRAGGVVGLDFCLPSEPIDIYLHVNPVYEYHILKEDPPRGQESDEGGRTGLYLSFGIRYFIGG